jgi:hypothetical protein
MAFSLVSGSNATLEYSSGGDSMALAFGVNVTAGNLLVAVGNVWNDPQTSSFAVSGSLHASGWTVYSGSASASATNTTVFLIWRVATSSGTETLTVNPSGSQFWGSMSVAEFTSGGTISLDTDNGHQTGSPTNAPFKNITTTAAVGLIVGVVGTDGANYPNPVTHTPGASYTQFGEIESTENASHNGTYRITSSATNYTVDWTFGSNQNYGIYVASFAETAGGGGGSTARHGLLLGVGF